MPVTLSRDGRRLSFRREHGSNDEWIATPAAPLTRVTQIQGGDEYSLEGPGNFSFRIAEDEKTLDVLDANYQTVRTIRLPTPKGHTGEARANNIYHGPQGVLISVGLGKTIWIPYPLPAKS